jgi:cold shock CspA family protein
MNINMSEEKLTGRVKWFDNKKGIGFITVVDGEKKDSDIFVHHLAVMVSSEQFRYLVQGEYVEFSLAPSSGKSKDKFEFQAANVSGVRGGQLMCETKNESRKTRDDAPVSRGVSVRGSGPREELQETIQTSPSSSSSSQLNEVSVAVETASDKKPRARGRPAKSKIA